MQKGITKEIIFKESEKLIKAYGFENFSVRILSAELGIKPASLYNHIESVEDIYNHLAKKSAAKMSSCLKKAVKDKSPDEALIAGANAYRKFAETKREYYLILLQTRNSRNEETAALGMMAIKPLVDLLDNYGVSDIQRLHYMRILRAFMHGFVDISYNGFLQKNPISKDETFNIAIKSLTNLLKRGTLK